MKKGSDWIKFTMSRTLSSSLWSLLLFLPSVAALQAQNGIVVTPASLIFSTEPVGLSTSSQLITVTNTGTSSVKIAIVSLSPLEYHLTTGTATTLVPGSSTNYGVLFAPDAAQSFPGQFVLSLGGINTTIALSGTGVATGAVASVTPSSLNFPNQLLGSASPSQTLTVTNTGTSAMKLTGLSVTSPVFTVSGGLNATLNPGQSIPLTVTFRPYTTGPTTGTLDLSYDVLPDGGVSLTGNGLPATSLVVASAPALPTATQNAPYSATLVAAGGTSPYAWSLGSSSALPVGLSLSTSGLITGTLDPTIKNGTYPFTIQVTDANSNSASLLFTLVVASTTGANCTDLSYNVPGTSSPLVPIDDLGTGTYLGQQGGLYPGGTNIIPASHQSDGIAIAAAIQPLDSSGNPDPSGKYALISLGPSATLYEFKPFIQAAKADPAKNAHLVVVQGAQGGETLTPLGNVNSPFWPTITNYYLPEAGVTSQQVVVAWIEQLDAGMSGIMPSDITKIQAQMENLAQVLITVFPNLKIVYYSSRVYSGYSNDISTINPEPYAYDTGYAVKFMIQDQLNGNANLNYNPANGPVMAPWIAWGPYYWGNGMIPRSDGQVWACQDFQSDGVHPAQAGSMKVAAKLLNFLKTDPTATPWFLAPAIPAVQLSSASLTFPVQLVNTTSAAMSVTINNTGNATLNVSSIVSSDSEFAEADNCAGSGIAPSMACTINITFTPIAAGTPTATITINDNAQPGSQTISVTGTGTVTASPQVSLAPASLSFGNQAVGATSPGQSVTLTNIGNGALSISAIAVAGTNAGDFAEVNTCGAALAPQASCTITVTFTPTNSGNSLAQVQIADNATGSPQSISISGTGLNSAASLNPTALNFGNVVTNTTSKGKTITLTNTGTALVGAISISASSDYSQTNNCGSTLAAGANCAITVFFTPSTTASEVGTLVVSDTAINTPQTASLSGKGVLPVAISPSFLNFPKTVLNMTAAPLSFSVTNNQTQALTGIGIGIEGDYAQSNTCGTSLAAHAVCSVTVTFTPTAPGTRSGSLTLTDSASTSPQAASLKGKGTQPVTLSATVLTFGNQNVGTVSSSKVVVLTNWQSVPLNISAIAISGDFGQSNNCGASLPAGGTCTISFTFSPTATGTRSGTFTVTDDAANSPQTVSLSGTGK